MEKMKLRFTILFAIFVIGVVAGFVYHTHTPTSALVRDSKPPNNRFTYMGFYADKDNYGTNLINSRIPIFRGGILKTEIHAKEITWNRDEPVILKTVVIHEFSEDGKSLVASMTGDFGEIKFDEQNEINNIRMWGNTKINKFAIKEKIDQGGSQ